MGFDLEALKAAVARHGRVVRVVVAQRRGSAPRDAGAAMLVWQGMHDGGQSGTIGGGTLEHQASLAARQMLASGPDVRLSRHALGPDLGQCCGGAVQLLSEGYDAAKLAEIDGKDVIARPVAKGSDMPLAVRRILTAARGHGARPAPQLLDGWMVEPVAKPETALWIWGAGHVGRALVDVLAPLPDLAITWVDTAPDRYPDDVPTGVTALPAADPARLVGYAPAEAHHLILTYSHELDLALCHGLLGHSFASAGLIGSATKWARFRSRLAALGHSPVQIARICCPIGDPALGKHPQAIAIGVSACLLTSIAVQTAAKECRA
jgi:xanthine dehydrogenase accessory factor